MTGAGRFAPSPSADLHIGNLRTAILAWLFARSTGRRFLLRVEDLDDRTFSDVAARQVADLAAIGVTWDEPPEYQTTHQDRYDAVIADLTARGLVYECYCSRKDILQAPRAPHAPKGHIRAPAGTRLAERIRTGHPHYGCAATPSPTPSPTCSMANTPDW